MSFGEWCHLINEINNEYEFKRINYDTYEKKLVRAIYRAYVLEDEDYAKGIAKAHGYDIDRIIESEGNSW